MVKEIIPPSGWKPINEIHSLSDLPVISDTDLLFTKIVSSSERVERAKREQDAKDALMLVTYGHSIRLSKQQKDFVNTSQDILHSIARETGKTEQWWQQKLGLSDQAGRTPSPKGLPKSGSNKPGSSQRQVGPR